MPKANRYQSLHTTVIGPGRRAGGDPDPHPRDARDRRSTASPRTGSTRRAQGREPLRREPAVAQGAARVAEGAQGPAGVPRDRQGRPLPRRGLRLHAARATCGRCRAGATPVDFAYAVHTDVGHRCVGAKVNGRIVPLRYQIVNGDIIEILTQAGHVPSKDWLKFVRTSRAKARIKAWIKTEQRAQSVDARARAAREGAAQVRAADGEGAQVGGVRRGARRAQPARRRRRPSPRSATASSPRTRSSAGCCRRRSWRSARSARTRRSATSSSASPASASRRACASAGSTAR